MAVRLNQQLTKVHHHATTDYPSAPVYYKATGTAEKTRFIAAAGYNVTGATSAALTADACGFSLIHLMKFCYSAPKAASQYLLGRTTLPDWPGFLGLF